MNQTLVVVIEVMVAVFAFAIIVVYIQGALNKEQLCDGTPPLDSNGLVKGLETYDNPSQNLQWAYDSTATTRTPCKWRCDYNYVRSQNGCVLK